MNPLLAAFGVTVACTVAGRMAGRYFGHDTLGTIGGLAVGLYAGNAVGNAFAPKTDAIAPNVVKERQVERAAEKPAGFTPAVPFIGWSNGAAAQNAAKVARSSGRMAQRRSSAARNAAAAASQNSEPATPVTASSFFGLSAPLAGTGGDSGNTGNPRRSTANLRNRR